MQNEMFNDEKRWGVVKWGACLQRYYSDTVQVLLFHKLFCSSVFLIQNYKIIAVIMKFSGQYSAHTCYSFTKQKLQ